MNRSLARLPRAVFSPGVAALLGWLALSATPVGAATTTYTTAYSGGTITAGDTVILNNGATVTGNVVDNGTLQFNQTGTLTISSTVSGTGTLSLTNTGTLTLSATTAMPGIFGGTVVLDMTVNATQGRLKTANTGGTLGLVLGNSGTGTMNVNGGVAQVGNNFYLGYAAGGRGVVNLSSGTLSAFNLLVGGSGAGAFNLSGGSLAGTGGVLTVAESNSGTFTMSGGTISGYRVSIGKNAGSVGTATISTGSWDSGNAIAVGASGNGTLNVNGGAFTSLNATLGSSAGSAGTATVTSGTWTEQGGLTVGGSGTGTLSMTGGLVSVSGTLSQGASGTINLSAGGTLQIGVGGTTGVLAASTLTNNGTLLFNRSNASVCSGSISGSGALVKQGAGTLTLSGSNSYSGLTRISGGTLALSGSGSIGTGGLDLGTNGIFDLAALADGTSTLPATGNLSGAGTLSGNGKTLAVLGSFLPGNSSGTISVGPGLTLDLSNSGSSVFEVMSPAYTAGTFDLVNGSGSVVFGGILNLAFSNGPYADGVDVLQIFANTGGRSGSFSAVNATGLGAGQSAAFNPATGFVTVVPEPSACTSLFAAAGLASMMRWRRRRAIKATA